MFRIVYAIAIPIGKAHVRLAARYRATGDPVALLAWGILRPLYRALYACLVWMAV